MSAEFPILAAGTIAIAGGAVREGKFPENGGKAIIATVGLVIVASALGRTKAEPIVNGIAWLILLGAVYGAVPAFSKARSAAAKRQKK